MTIPETYFTVSEELRSSLGGLGSGGHFSDEVWRGLSGGAEEKHRGDAGRGCEGRPHDGTENPTGRAGQSPGCGSHQRSKLGFARRYIFRNGVGLQLSPHLFECVFFFHQL